LRRSSRRGTRSTGSHRQLVWGTVDGILSSSLVNGFQVLDMLPDIDLTSSALGSTVMRTHLTITPTTAPAVADFYKIGLMIGRNNEIGTNLAGVSLVDSPDLDWMFRRIYTFNGGIEMGGGNIISIDLRAKRKLSELNQRYVLAIGTNTGAAVQFRIYARTLLALS